MRKVYLAAVSAFIAVAGSGASAAELLIDSAFSASSIYPAAGPDAFLYPQATLGAWTYTGGVDVGAGLVDSSFPGEGFLVYGAPTGANDFSYAFLQSVGTISQTFTAPAAGALSVTWIEAGRFPGGVYAGTEDYFVEVDGVTYGSFKSADSQNFIARALTTASLAAGSHTITFVGGTDPDQTAFLDDVSVMAAVPEPQTWALLFAGLGLMGTVARRRR